MPRSNPHFDLVPRTDFNGPVLKFELDGLEIGVAEYDEGPTGCTVFRFPDGVLTAVDVRGGLVGMTRAFDFSHAICFAGGSLLGLEAAAGVTVGLFAMGDYDANSAIELVNGAIIYDYGGRDTTVYPDKTLGLAALNAAISGKFPLGARGAGRSASVGKALGWNRAESAGQGGAIRVVDNVKVTVFTIVNALGAVHDRDGKVIRGNFDQKTGKRERSIDLANQKFKETGPPAKYNTTLTMLATNVKLEHDALTQLGRQVHSSMARAIQPFHTQWDGDVLYTVTTSAVETKMDLTTLGIIGSEVAWDAVLAAVQNVK